MHYCDAIWTLQKQENTNGHQPGTIHCSRYDGTNAEKFSDDLDIYIDDIGIFSKSWDDHLIVFDKVCKQLENKYFSVNPLKCEFGVKESDFLVHWLTPKGVKPLGENIQGIIDMEAPTNLSQLRSFLGMVTYYQDMWPKRSHILSPLTELVGSKEYN